MELELFEMFFFIFLILASNPILEVGLKYFEKRDFEKAYQVFSQIYSVSRGSYDGNWAKYYMSLCLLGLNDTASALGNLLSLRNEVLDDSLAYETYRTLLDLCKEEGDSLKYITELVIKHPSFPNRKAFIDKYLGKLPDENRIELIKILASDYENKFNEIRLGESLLTSRPGPSLLLADRHKYQPLKIKALYRNKKFLDFYWTLSRDNPRKILPEEAVEFAKETGNSPLVIASLFSLTPENEKTAFIFANILTQQNLSSSKLTKAIRDTLYRAYFSIPKLSIEDLSYFENLPPSNIRNYILSRGYLQHKYFLKSLYFATVLPDSEVYNALKLEIFDTLIARGFISQELEGLIRSINLYYPLSERDKRLEQLRQSTALILNYDDSKFLSLPDTLIVKNLYYAKRYKELVEFTKGKAMPSYLKPFIAEALLFSGSYTEVLQILENEAWRAPGIFVRALLKVENPESYLEKIPQNLSQEDAFYLYKLAVKLGKPGLLKGFKGQTFSFYRAVLNRNLDEAFKFYIPSDKDMLRELSLLLFDQERYSELINLTQGLNPLYPDELEIFTYRLKALFSMGNYSEILNEVESIPLILPSNTIYDIAALSAINMGDYDRAFIHCLRSTSDTARKALSVCLLKRGYIDLVDTNYLDLSEKIYYYYQKKSAKDLTNLVPENKEDALNILKYVTLLTGKVPDSLYFSFSRKYEIDDALYDILKGFKYCGKNQTDSLKVLLLNLEFSDPELFYLASQILLEAGEVNLAKELLNQALTFASDTLKHSIFFRLGNIEAMAGNYSSSIYYYVKALEYGVTYEKEILYNLSIAFKNTNQLDSCIYYLETLSEKYPYDEISIEAALLVGYLLVDRQINVDKAIEILESIIGIGTKEQDCEALYWLARAYMTKQELKMALSLLKRIYTHYAEFPDWRDTAKLDAAKIFVYHNHQDVAKRLYEEIIKARGKDDPASQQALEEMKFFKL